MCHFLLTYQKDSKSLQFLFSVFLDSIHQHPGCSALQEDTLLLLQLGNDSDFVKQRIKTWGLNEHKIMCV